MSAKLLCSFTVAGFDSGGTSMIARVDHQPGMSHEQALNEYRKAALAWAKGSGDWLGMPIGLSWTYILLNAHLINEYSARTHRWDRVTMTFLADWEHVETVDLEQDADKELML